MFVLNEDGELVSLYGSAHGDDHCMVHNPFYPKANQTPSVQKIIKNSLEGIRSGSLTNNGIVIQKVYTLRQKKKAKPTFFKRNTKLPTHLELSTMSSRIKIKRKLKGAGK